jgi:aminoglycoside phosphotransferase (APT) family kinase protein
MRGPEPWAPERVVDAELARALIEAQFPQLAPVRADRLGEGWDNTVFSINEAWVFRFPRRQIAVPLIEAELRILPALPPLPLPAPRPELRGAPGAGYPWPFAGYRLLPGRTADEAALTPLQRARAAIEFSRTP